MEEQINAGQAQLDGAQSELTAKKSELAQTRATLESSLGQINEASARSRNRKRHFPRQKHS